MEQTKHSLKSTESEVLKQIGEHPAMQAGRLQEVWRMITAGASRVLGVERSSVWLLEDNDTQLRCHCLYVASEDAHTDNASTLTSREYPSYFLALVAGHTINAIQARVDPRTREFKDGYLVPLDIHSMLDSTIRYGGRIVGVVCNETVGCERSWTPEDIAFSSALAELATTALKNANPGGSRPFEA